MAKSSVLASAATSASYNMILQLMMRLMTFFLNAVILRVISRDVLGLVNVRLMLLYTTTLFVAREAFRRACLSTDLEKPWQQVINFLWLTVPLGVIFASVFGVIWAYWLEQPDATVVQHYRLAVVCFSVSTVIELLAEPLWISGQMLLHIRVKVVIEGLSLLVRCLCSVGLIVFFPHLGLVAFSAAQLAQTLSYTLMYYGYFVRQVHKQTDDEFPFKSITDILPRKITGQPLISWSLAGLTWSFFKQGFLKQILTEGERYIMTVFDVLSFGDQGVYDVINNLGSLVARFLFLPLEDSSYLFFSQTLKRGIPAREQEKESMVLASQVLQYLLKVVTVIGLVFLTFGFSYSFLVLDLYGGSVLSMGSGPALLRCYCLYVLILAVNGITECFTFATMGKQDIDRYNHKMLIFSVVLLVSSWYLVGPLGSAGFILANCLNMLARIAHSVYYIRVFYKSSEHRPLNIFPSTQLMFVFSGSTAVTVFSEVYLCCSHGWFYRLLHISIGAVCLCAILVTVYVSEKPMILFIKQQYLQSKQPSKQSQHSNISTAEKKRS